MTNEEALKYIPKLLIILAFATVNTEEMQNAKDALMKCKEALENCPSKSALCYGCHENCRKCELQNMAMI